MVAQTEIDRVQKNTQQVQKQIMEALYCSFYMALMISYILR